jgi:hypothetical protein
LPALILLSVLVVAAPVGEEVVCPAEAAPPALEWNVVSPGIDHARGGWGKPVKPGAKQKGPLPVAFHLLRVTLGEAGDEGGLSLRALRVPDRSAKVEEMVAWARAEGETVEAAVNGDYYPPGQSAKDPLGMLVSDGRLLAAARGTSSLLLDSHNRAHVGLFPLAVRLVGPELDLPIADMNRKAGRNEAVLHAGRYRTRSEPQWGCRSLRLALSAGEPMMNRTVPVTVSAAGDAGRVRSFQREEYLLVACGKQAQAITAVKEGDPLWLETRLEGIDWVPVEALSGGPRILRDGRVGIETAQEKLTGGMKGWVPKRHPRTAVGVGGEGQTVFLLVAEGRLPHTDGMTAIEAACVLKAVGADDALLFDGGGSSSLLLGEKFVSKPQVWHNRSGRAVADVLAVVREGPTPPPQEE